MCSHENSRELQFSFIQGNRISYRLNLKAVFLFLEIPQEERTERARYLGEKGRGVGWGGGGRAAKLSFGIIQGREGGKEVKRNARVQYPYGDRLPRMLACKTGLEVFPVHPFYLWQ